ncbi:LolA family protein [Desulfomarina sp.]
MRKTFPFAFSFFLLFLSLTYPLYATQPPVEPVKTAARLQARIDTIKSISFQFYQQTRGELTGRPRKGSGRAIFLKDNNRGLMRWDYTSPDRQVLVSDGRLFSMYFEKLHQMIVTPAEKLKNDLTYSFFIGHSRLTDDFYILPPDPDIGGHRDGMSVIRLVPKIPHAQIENIHLWVTGDSLIRRITLLDHFGTETVLSFSDIQIDPLKDLDEKAIRDMFSFTPPENTEIIEQ